MHIAVAGNIGSGKSTLTRLLAKHYGWEPRFESVDSNPYLEDYYRDIHRWSFNMEVYFLKERFRDLIDIAKSDHTIIQDRTVYEGVHVFMENNREMGNLSERDYETYMELFEQMMSVVKLPDLMIYLRASVPHLVSNIQKRGRDYEQSIQLEYLQNLNRRYDDFVFNKYPGRVITIEKDNLDFLNTPRDLAGIIDKIDATLISTEQIPGEVFHTGDRVKVYVVEVKDTTKGPRVIVSRTHPELVKRFFENEVSEVADGTVEIKALSREAGKRTKMAVYSNDPKVDPVGACVGVNGSRVNAVVEELNGEKIDVINWSDDPAHLIANALSPAEVISVDVIEEERLANVIVPDDQLTLAIGSKGQNARLAARLTGYKIDIKSESQAAELM